LAQGPRSVDPAPVDDVLAAVIERHAGRSGLAGARLIEEWATIGGEEWGAKARAVSVRDGVLVVEVQSGGDATMLRYDEGAIRSRIGARFGAELVTAIRVRVAGSGGRR
jgi:predicted nucleic acid-binding Zn ribbon protein